MYAKGDPYMHLPNKKMVRQAKNFPQMVLASCREMLRKAGVPQSAAQYCDAQALIACSTYFHSRHIAS